MARQLIITGMHRSGTSFIANWMKDSGLYIGDRLAGATPSNINGHFEDIDFLELHEQMLKANQTTMYLSDERILAIEEIHRKKAELLCSARNSVHELWGFKQPRAALFLDLWRDLLPDAHYLIPLRNPVDVVNSIVRRESNKLEYRNNGVLGVQLKEAYLNNLSVHARAYDDMQAIHLKRILEHIQLSNETNVLLVDFDKIDEMENLIQEQILAWNFPIEMTPLSDLFAPNLLIGRDTSFVNDESISKKTKKIYRKLLNMANTSI